MTKAPRRPKSGWSRKLTKPFVMGKRRLVTLSDVRSYVLGLPEARQEHPANIALAGALLDVAAGGSMSKVDIALYFSRMMDRG